MVRPPCQVDYEETGRDWTNDNLTRREAERMAQLCRACPLKVPCHREAVANLPDTHGIWAGALWRNGKPISLTPDTFRKRSVHEGVVWDHNRNRWKAFGQIPKSDTQRRRHFHLGYYDDEDRAAIRARSWRIEHGQAP